MCKTVEEKRRGGIQIPWTQSHTALPDPGHRGSVHCKCRRDKIQLTALQQ